jgi:NAD(P)-dependent dehydrogenase (short-subunit alcohol dehydrogenase family)
MLDGKVAIVTGAARGIGRAFVETLARASAKVMAADVSDCDETVKIAGPNTAAVKADVGETRSAEAMVDAAVERFGRLDILVNNAALYGALHGGRFDKIDEDEWEAAMRVNVKGVWLACKAAVPHMRKVGGGSIVNMASLAALYGTPFALHYTVSKAAVIGMTRALARELGPRQYPGERDRAVGCIDRRHQAILRRQTRPRAGGDRRRPVDPAQPQADRRCRRHAVASLGPVGLHYRPDYCSGRRHGDAVMNGRGGNGE